MSLKSITQLIIILLIIIILCGVYLNYFVNNEKISMEISETKIEEEKSHNLSELEKKKKLSKKLNIVTEKNDAEVVDTEFIKLDKEKVDLIEEQKKTKPKIDNVVKEIEYITTDEKGNKYKILASSGRTNSKNKNVLDLDNVKGIITSNERSTVNIISDFAEYNSLNLKSNFYQNVVINYEDKEITCDYFDIDMKTNIAIAYNNVVVTDSKSVMKAGKIILNIETKKININPDNKKNKVKITIN